MTDSDSHPRNHPSESDLVALEHELDTLLVEYAILSEAWPRAPGAVNRANIGRQVDSALRRIHEKEVVIVNSQARTLDDAAVQLRRLEAMIDDPACRRLVASVLGVVEGA